MAHALNEEDNSAVNANDAFDDLASSEFSRSSRGNSFSLLVSTNSKIIKSHYVVKDTANVVDQTNLPSGSTATPDNIKRVFVPDKFFKMVGPKSGKEKTVHRLHL